MLQPGNVPSPSPSPCRPTCPISPLIGCAGTFSKSHQSFTCWKAQVLPADQHDRHRRHRPASERAPLRLPWHDGLRYANQLHGGEQQRLRDLVSQGHGALGVVLQLGHHPRHIFPKVCRSELLSQLLLPHQRALQLPSPFPRQLYSS